MSKFHNWLKVAVRLVVFVATCLAAFPVWQWWVEAEQRRLNRAANLVQGYALCESLWLAHLDRRTEMQTQAESWGFGPDVVEGWDKTQLKLSVLCLELDKAVQEDLLARKEAENRGWEIPAQGDQ